MYKCLFYNLCIFFIGYFNFYFHPINIVFLLYYKYINWRASEASETLSGVYKFELMRYIYMYGGTYAIIVAHTMHT